ncbi:helix-turn-helix domain-containing protein [Lachnospiraceae bacterium ZAX-1]
MKSLDFKRIGTKIKERRLSQKLTQDCLAEQLGVNPSHVSNIECGRAHPSLTALVHIAVVLECSVDYFLSAEYGYCISKEEVQSYDDKILNMLSDYDIEKKDRIIKMMELL